MPSATVDARVSPRGAGRPRFGPGPLSPNLRRRVAREGLVTCGNAVWGTEDVARKSQGRRQRDICLGVNGSSRAGVCAAPNSTMSPEHQVRRIDIRPGQRPDMTVQDHASSCEHERRRQTGCEVAGLPTTALHERWRLSWPSGAALRGEAPNHLALRPLTAVRGERHGKGAPRVRQVRSGKMVGNICR